MAWTAPRTWVAGEVVTAALLNTHLRDNLKAVGDAWTTYAPTWTGVTVGNGTVDARYSQYGKTVHFFIQITWGSTTSFTGNQQVTAPVAARAGTTWAHRCDYVDTGSGRVIGHGEHSGSNIILYVTSATAGAYERQISPTIPFTWANTDVLIVHGTYETA